MLGDREGRKHTDCIVMHDVRVCQDLVKRAAEREAARKADMKKPDKHSSQAERDTWRLRDEREV